MVKNVKHKIGIIETDVSMLWLKSNVFNSSRFYFCQRSYSMSVKYPPYKKLTYISVFQNDL